MPPNCSRNGPPLIMTSLTFLRRSVTYLDPPPFCAGQLGGRSHSRLNLSWPVYIISCPFLSHSPNPSTDREEFFATLWREVPPSFDKWTLGARVGVNGLKFTTLEVHSRVFVGFTNMDSPPVTYERR